MSGAEGVVFAFGPLGEARKAATLTQRTHAPAPAGQDLVRVGLVADIPDDLVLRRIKDALQCDREFNDAETGAEMAAGDRNRVNKLHPQFIGRLPKLSAIKASQIAWERNPIEQWRLQNHQILMSGKTERPKSL